MVNISTQNPQSVYSIRNKFVDGLTLNVVTGGSGNLASVATDLTQLQLKATLKRGGNEVVLFNTTAKNILIMSLIFSPLYYYIFYNSQAQTLVAGPTKILQPYRIDFGGPINLTQNDELIIEWQLNSSFFSATNLSLSASYIEMDECETTDIEYITPVLDVKVIEGSQQNPTYSLGDNVLSIILANYDKTDILEASAVVNSIKLSSNQMGKNDNYRELLCKLFSYYPDLTQAALRVQNFALYAGSDELDGVSLDLNLNTSNVTSSKNFVLTRSFITSDWLVTRAETILAAKNARSDKKGQYDASLLKRSTHSN